MTTALELRAALDAYKQSHTQLVEARQEATDAQKLIRARDAFLQSRQALLELRTKCSAAPAAVDGSEQAHAASEQGSVVADGTPGRPKDPQPETVVEAVRPSQHDPKAPAHSSQWAMTKTSETDPGPMTLLTTSCSASILADVLRGRWDGQVDS